MGIINKVKQTPKTFLAIIGFIAFSCTGCFAEQLETTYYRLTVEINTPEGVKIGSGVRWFTLDHSVNPKLIPQVSSLIASDGEDIFVDLGEKGKIYVEERNMQDNNFQIFIQTFINDVDFFRMKSTDQFQKVSDIPYNKIFFVDEKIYPDLALGQQPPIIGKKLKEKLESFKSRREYKPNYLIFKKFYFADKKKCKENDSLSVSGNCLIIENYFQDKIGEGYGLKSVYLERIEKPDNFDEISVGKNKLKNQ